jgi:hypothetical protein
VDKNRKYDDWKERKKGMAREEDKKEQDQKDDEENRLLTPTS